MLRGERLGLGKEAAVGHACSLVAELGGEEDARLQSLTDGVEEAVKRRVKGSLGRCRAGGADGAKVGDILVGGVGGRHAGFIMARCGRTKWCGV